MRIVGAGVAFRDMYAHTHDDVPEQEGAAAEVFQPLCAQIEFFERAAAFPGLPRERLVALGEAEEMYFRRFPHHYRALQTIRVASQLSRIMGDQRDPTNRCESRLLTLLTRVIREAVTEQHLQLKQPMDTGELSFTIWALAFGTRALMDTRVAYCQLGIEDGFRVSREATELLLDAIDWHPVRSEWDYAATRMRIRQWILEGVAPQSLEPADQFRPPGG